MSDFILHERDEDFGNSIIIMEKTGKSYGRIYWYTDNELVCYLAGLSVDKNFLGKGFGNQLLKKLESIAIERKALTIHLWVKKNSWQYKWYNRNGYVYFGEFDSEHDWLIKQI